MSALLDAVRALDGRLILAEAIAASMDALGGDDPPPWVYVFREQVEAIRAAAEAVEALVVRGEAAP